MAWQGPSSPVQRDALRPLAVWYTLEAGGKIFSGPAPENAYSFGNAVDWWWIGSSGRLAHDYEPPVFAGGRWWPDNLMVTFVRSEDATRII